MSAVPSGDLRQAFRVLTTPNGTTSGDGASATEFASFNLTDMGNAERLRHQHGQDLRYCGQLGQWLEYDGTHFAADVTGGVVVRAKVTTRTIYAEASAEPDEKRRAAL